MDPVDSEIVSEIVQLLSMIILWAGGFLAAPLLFMATLGVFRNLAGMSTGVFKGVSGKIRAPGKEARALGKQPTREAKQMKREGIAYSRHARKRQGLRGARNAITGQDGGLEELRDAVNPISATRDAIGRAKGRSDMKDALYSTGADQRDPSVQAGHLTEKAAQIQASAGAINAEKLYSEHFDAATSNEVPGDVARKEALDQVAQHLLDKLENGTATQSEVTGTITFLGQQKNAAGIDKVQEGIANIEDSDNAIKASQQYSSALGNAGAFAALTKVNPGYKHIPMKGQDVGELRRSIALSEAPEKLADATNAVWKDIAINGTVDQKKQAAEIAANIQKMGGEAALKLDLPKMPDPPPATPGPSPDGKDWQAEDIAARNAEITKMKEFYDAYNNKMTS